MAARVFSRAACVLTVVLVPVRLGLALERSTTARSLGPSRDLRDRGEGHPGCLAPRAASRALAAAAGVLLTTSSFAPPALSIENVAEVGKCVVTQCSLPLAKCLASPKCAANLVCIQTCNGRSDETECQIRCGDLFDNEVIGEFNACAVSQKKCVPKRLDDGAWPVPPASAVVDKFDTKLFDGRWFISAGLNPIFDTFDCQVHFFNAPAPGKLYGKLNWRIQEPDGEFFDKNTIQQFIQDPKQPGVLYNHDNEYLHYQDDWYILGYNAGPKVQDDDAYVLVYYRGSNDAWDGYGGAVLYTKARNVSPAVAERAAADATKGGLNFADFLYPDNSCSELKNSDRQALRGKFANGVLLTAERELQEEATSVRKVAASTITADVKEVEKATGALERLVVDFEKIVEADVIAAEKTIEKDIVAVEKTIEADVVAVEREIVKDVSKPFSSKR